MARGAPQNLTVRLSVLDRLLDDQPTVAREPPLGTQQALRQAVAAVRRDLENLLNCRQTWIDDDVLENETLAAAITGFGLPDFSGSALDASDSRKRVQRAIEYAVARFEPRLKNVIVSPEAPHPDRREFRFRIDAMLHVDPVREPVTFDTVVLTTGAAEVSSI